jgi:hypothetical protein
VSHLFKDLASDKRTRATHVHEVVEQADVPDASTSSDPTTVLCLLDRVDGDRVGDSLDETRRVAGDEDTEAERRKKPASGSKQ